VLAVYLRPLEGRFVVNKKQAFHTNKSPQCVIGSALRSYIPTITVVVTSLTRWDPEYCNPKSSHMRCTYLSRWRYTFPKLRCHSMQYASFIRTPSWPVLLWNSGGKL